MTLRIHFSGLRPGEPLVLIAWAAFAKDERLSASTPVHFGRELADAFDRHWSIASTIEDCDVVIYPHSYEDGPQTAAVAKAARLSGKPCLFFSQDERLPPSHLAYGVLYRSSIFERLAHERCHPVFINDPTTERAGPVSLPKTLRPRVGFCGYVGTPISRLLFRLAGARQKADGLSVRAAVLAALRRDQRIECDFIARATYLGHATFAAFDRRHPLADARDAFLANLFGCPYNIAIRGKGNHSVRFYEILAASRIPLFVNTNCALPLEREIDWRSHTVWVEETDLPRIGDLVTTVHDSTNDEDFQQRQQANRRLWETRLMPEPFFRHVLAKVAEGQPAP